MAEPLASAGPVPLPGSGPFLRVAPRLSLPLRHFAFAAAAFWLFSAAFALATPRFLGFGFDARFVLGLVHLLTLGWVSMTILGAMVQMLPVHGEVPLWSGRGVAAAWWLLAAGIVGFVGHLWSGSDSYWVPAALLVTALVLYLLVFGRTMTSARTTDWTGRHFALALVYLALVATLGILLAYDRQRAVLFPDPEGVLIAHVHLALVGWVSLPILGASYRLVPAVALSRLASKIPGWAVLALANAGLIGLALDSLLFGRSLMPLWAALLAGAHVIFFLQFLRGLKESKWKMMQSTWFVVLAMAGGAAWACLGLGLAFGWIMDAPEARAAYVFSALIGWATPYILSQIHKILPFLVWLHVYSPRQWTPPVSVPKIGDLTSARLAWVELGALAPAIALGIPGFLLESEALLRGSGALLFVAATAYAVNTALTLLHLLAPDPRWTLPREGE